MGNVNILTQNQIVTVHRFRVEKKFRNFFELCSYKSDCVTHEKEKNYHENTKVRKHEKDVSNLPAEKLFRYGCPWIRFILFKLMLLFHKFAAFMQ